MTKTEVIASVAGDLNSAEQALDEAIARATALVQSMIGSRTALSLSPVLGAESQAKAMEAIASLAVARQAMVACHEELAKDHRRMGWGVFMDIPLDKGVKPQAAAERRLRAV